MQRGVSPWPARFRAGRRLPAQAHAEHSRDENEPMPPHLIRPETRIVAPSWNDGWKPQVDTATVRGILWCRRAMLAAYHRCNAAQTIAFDQWTAAVEAVWWAVALDDVLHSFHDGRYLTERALHRDGQTVLGLRWLRHQHAHRIVVTGQGGPKHDFIGGAGEGMYYISPSNRWLERSAIATDGRRRDDVAEAAYDALIARHPLANPITASLTWFDAVLTAAGIDPNQDIAGDDPTVL